MWLGIRQLPETADIRQEPDRHRFSVPCQPLIIRHLWRQVTKKLPHERKSPILVIGLCYLNTFEKCITITKVLYKS
ncbi:MAG: hypothetical protein KAX28_06355, partial [Candidatus Marinimicrobia bacterium]|nr:hypothetical protein [Candidatus Neomarinimicrobiota bacterium]